MDEVKPSDLSLNFLREFMELPLSYYSQGAPIKYRKYWKTLTNLIYASSLRMSWNVLRANEVVTCNGPTECSDIPSLRSLNDPPAPDQARKL